MSGLIGQHFGSYRIDGLLGAGLMGEVYRAHDTTLGRDVALKFLPREFVNPERLARFEREARLFALELVEGETLADRLARAPVEPSESVAIARQIADALDAAHSRGIVHRDRGIGRRTARRLRWSHRPGSNWSTRKPPAVVTWFSERA